MNDYPSRREFIATSMSAFALAAAGSIRAQPRGAGIRLYVGTYTEGTKSQGVYRLSMDPASGVLTIDGSADAGPNPSFLALHPNGRVLYAVNEIEQYSGQKSGAVTALAIASTGALTKLNEQPTLGGAPCYVSVDRTGRLLLVANYMGGNVASFPLLGDGTLGAPTAYAHAGTGPNKERQEGPHAHCIVPDNSNVWALSADLGADRVFVYHMALDEHVLHDVGVSAATTAGAGPRHVVFHPTLPLAYVANELDNTVTTLRFSTSPVKLDALGSVSTLPKGFSGTSYAADIHVSKSGRLLYVSNRGHNSIAVFTVSSSGALELIQTISTEGDWPRNFALDPSERYVLVANQRSNSITVFQRDASSGRLSSAGARVEIPSPVCVLFG